jgi:hypothetical protein
MGAKVLSSWSATAPGAAERSQLCPLGIVQSLKQVSVTSSYCILCLFIGISLSAYAIPSARDQAIGMHRFEESKQGEVISIVRSCYMTPAFPSHKIAYLNDLAAADVDLYLHAKNDLSM